MDFGIPVKHRWCKCVLGDFDARKRWRAFRFLEARWSVILLVLSLEVVVGLYRHVKPKSRCINKPCKVCTTVNGVRVHDQRFETGVELDVCLKCFGVRKLFPPLQSGSKPREKSLKITDEVFHGLATNILWCTKHVITTFLWTQGILGDK